VAVVLGKRLPKSKKITTSNWASPDLSPQQLQYAANDAHASLMIYGALIA
jgi:ribonuclease D